MAATGRPAVPDLSGFPEDMREYFEAQYKALVITEAVNGSIKERPSWDNHDTEKWFPWFLNNGPSSGFAFDDTAYSCSCACAGFASRLCLTDGKRARYVGENFTEVHDAILRK